MLALASLVLDFAALNTLSRFVVVWLRPTPMRPYLDVTIWDASSWCRLLRAYLFPFPLRAMICLPCLFVSPIGFLCLHACLHIHAWVLMANVSSMLQHNEAMDIRSKPTFVPCGHQLLFAFLLVFLFACLLAFLFLCLPCLSCLSALCLFICSLPLFLLLLVCWLLVFAFACTHMEQGHIELGHGLPGTSKKGVDANMSV